jgi:hypothetical protein
MKPDSSTGCRDAGMKPDSSTGCRVLFPPNDWFSRPIMLSP